MIAANEPRRAGVQGRRLRVGVVGVGHLGKEHARVYAQNAEVELAGIYDVDGERARAVAETHGVPSMRSLAELVACVDAVSIVVPTPVHREAAMPFIEAGKAVLVEKPLAGSLAEADALISLADKHGALLQVGHIERFNPIVQAALPLIEAPVFIECDRIHPFNLRSTDVSVVLDLMIHDLDLVLHFTNDEIEEIDGFGSPVLSMTADLASARIVFRGGCVALVKTSRVAMHRSRKIRVFCERSYISLDLIERKGMRIAMREGYDPARLLDAAGRLSAPLGEAAFLAENLRMEPLTIAPQDALAAELRAFTDAARTGGTPKVTGTMGRRAMAAAAAIEEKIAARRAELARRRNAAPAAGSPKVAPSPS